MNNTDDRQMYQISTLQALLLGYSKGVVRAEELMQHGSIGLGTFADVNGEMIALDGKVYKANNIGVAKPVAPDEGIPFAAVTYPYEPTEFELGKNDSIDTLKANLNNAIEEDFGLNSMYVVRIDGKFTTVKARSEEGQRSHHVALSEILKKNQKDFTFENIEGTMVCMYFPDYMDGINAPGWHLHFISDDRKCGGHVFDLCFDHAKAYRTKVQNIQIQLPRDAAFDTYSLKAVPKEEVAKVEQSKD